MPADCQINDCGVIALGRCTDCDRAFCSSHQAKVVRKAPLLSTVDALDICVGCQAARNPGGPVPGREAERARQRAIELASEDRYQREDARKIAARDRERVTQRASALAVAGSIPDPTLKLILAATHWVKEREMIYLAGVNYASTDSRPHADPVEAALFSDTFPEYWRSPDEVDLNAIVPPWDSLSILGWFTAQAGQQRLKPDNSYPVSGLFGTSDRPAWRFRSTGWIASKNTYDQHTHQVAINHRNRLLSTGSTLSAFGLQDIAHTLSIKDHRFEPVWLET